MKDNEFYLKLTLEMDPPVDLSVAEIAKRANFSWTSTIQRLAPLKDRLQLPEKYMPIANVLVPYSIYSRLNHITETETPAEDWMTIHHIGLELDVDEKWITRRILWLHAVGEFRLGNKNRSYFYLPPAALEEIEEVRNEVLVKVDPSKLISIPQLSQRLGRHKIWVASRIDSLNVDPVLGLSESGHTTEFFPIEIFHYLQKLQESYSDSGGRVTVRMLTKELGKSREWIEAQLEAMGAEGEYRNFKSTGRVDLSFEPTVTEELLLRASEYVEPDLGWNSAAQLARITGKSDTWVSNRLANSHARTRQMIDVHGIKRTHYSPQTSRRIIKLAKGWNISSVVRSEDDEISPDTAGRFLEIYDSAGSTMSLIEYEKLGVSEDELKKLIKMGLMTKWSSGKYRFTKQGHLVAERIRIADEFVKKLSQLRDLLERK